MLKEVAHSQELAEAAVGLGTDNGKRKSTLEDAEEMSLDNT